jgi:hypothetical protein
MAATESGPSDDAGTREPASGAGQAVPEAAGQTTGEPLHKHHPYKILEDVLEDTEQDLPVQEASRPRFGYPMILDAFVGVGLLIIAAGFTLGLFKMYLQHCAEESIKQHNYKAAITILKDSPLPSFIQIAGADPDELLDRSLYLDAVEQLDQGTDEKEALKELQQIRPGSKYFSTAQELITEHTVPSGTQLQGGTEHLELNPPPKPKPSPLEELDKGKSGTR